MEVKVLLYTVLKKYGEGKIRKDDRMNVPDRITLESLASLLDIPDKPGKVFLVNGSPRDKEYILQEGDEVKILSFIGGG
ncbi:MAG: hypothetical protein AMS17_01800 [Spirochaetes bacterium DG_61]|jgi:sulfur carrier protein ThiS|nr:MAG: hypothetical protein AMS17_01800 [Spirochaetes bacterium DG_61]